MRGCTFTVCVCVSVHIHLCAACLMVFNLREGLSRYLDQRATSQLLPLSFVLCNHKAPTTDTNTWRRLRYCVTGQTFHSLLSLLKFFPLIFFLSLCLFLDCSLPKCESKLDGPGQTSGRSDCHTFIIKVFLPEQDICTHC